MLPSIIDEIGEPAFVSVGKKTFPFTSLKHASDAYQAARDKSGLGASITPHCDILDKSGNVVAWLSYNGRAWLGNDRAWKSGKPQEIVFDSEFSARWARFA